jgi:hypothetical protein
MGAALSADALFAAEPAVGLASEPPAAFRRGLCATVVLEGEPSSVGGDSSSRAAGSLPAGDWRLETTAAAAAANAGDAGVSSPLPPAALALAASLEGEPLCPAPAVDEAPPTLEPLVLETDERAWATGAVRLDWWWWGLW